MENKNFMTVDEVAQELNVSKSYAYKVVRELNAEMHLLLNIRDLQIFIINWRNKIQPFMRGNSRLEILI